MADLRLRVDWIRCDGYGACGDLLPEAIDFDEWRYPILRPGTVERRQHCRQLIAFDPGQFAPGRRRLPYTCAA